MKKTIYVVRHGQTDYNLNGLVQGRNINAPLNETGRRQSELLKNWFKGKPIQEIHCSSLLRTHETARPVAEEFGISPQQHRELDEVDFGILEGKPAGDPESEFHQLRADWDSGNISRKAPGGESAEMAYERAGIFGKELISKSSSEHILLVIHGRLIRILLSGWLGYGLSRMGEIRHQNAAINILYFEESKFKAGSLNITSHLETL